MDELEAARECVMAVGVRRTTFSDVARRASISRMTLYRRHPDITSLLSALIARDLGEIVADTQAEVRDQPTGRQRLVEALIRGGLAMTSSPLVLRILEVDPELLMPYVFDRMGETQRAVLDLLKGYIVDGQRDRSIRSGDPTEIAACLELAARGFVFAARARERACEPAEAFEQLRAMVDAYLMPTR
jgi:AcrR family transcriptional regulator